MSGRAVEAAGDVDTLLLDKTGTITYGNRLAAEFIPVGGASQECAGRGGLPARASATRRRRASIVTWPSAWRRAPLAPSPAHGEGGNGHAGSGRVGAGAGERGRGARTVAVPTGPS